MKMELKSIGYWSLLKISFVINFVMGLVGGFLYALFLGFFVAVAGRMGSIEGFGFSPDELPAFGIMIIIFPLLFGFGAAVFNTIIYIILAFVYNVTAKAFGGIELDFKEVIEAAPYTLPPQYARPQSAPQSQAPPPQTPPEQKPAPAPPPPPPPVQPYPEPSNEEEKKDEENKPDENPPGPSGV